MVNQSDVIMVMVLARAAHTVRGNMFENKTVFNGTSDSNYQPNPVPDKSQASQVWY